MLWIASKEAVYPVCQLVEALLESGAVSSRSSFTKSRFMRISDMRRSPVAGDAVHKAFIAAAKLLRAAALCLSGAPGAVG